MVHKMLSNSWLKPFVRVIHACPVPIFRGCMVTERSALFPEQWKSNVSSQYRVFFIHQILQGPFIASVRVRVDLEFSMIALYSWTDVRATCTWARWTSQAVLMLQCAIVASLQESGVFQFCCCCCRVIRCTLKCRKTPSEERGAGGVLLLLTGLLIASVWLSGKNVRESVSFSDKLSNC